MEENSNISEEHLPVALTTPGSTLSPDSLIVLFSEIHTERLVLRRLLSTDGPALFAIDGDPATHQYNPSGPDLHLAASEERLRFWLQNWEDDGFGYWTVTLPLSKQVLGFGGVRRLIWREREVLNLYYRFTPSAWGQGYATEVAKTAVALSQKYLPMWPIIARTRPENVASIRTAERAGLQRHTDLDTEHIVLALGWLTGDNY